MSGRVVLLACGCFNPPHLLHVRIFEIARNYLKKQNIQTVQGWLSPASDGYGKPGLVSSDHRVKMCELITESSDWISVSKWEAQNPEWTPTASAVEHHAKRAKNEFDAELRLLVGADFLESFCVPGLWLDSDVARIAEIGIVAVARNEIDHQTVLQKHEILKKFKNKITLVKDVIPNSISSTLIRSSLRNDESIRYLTTDNVVEYLNNNKLYDEASEKKNADVTLAPLRNATSS